MKRTAVIAGVGSYAPENIVSNEDIIKKFEKFLKPEQATQIKQIIVSRGYYNRRIATDPEETTGTMGAKAAIEALKNAGINAAQLDLIILATDSPDYITPATSARIQHLIGARCGFFDLNTACASFTTALTTGWNFLRADENMKYILVIGSYEMSRFIPPDSLEGQISFADGAGAFVLKAVENSKCGLVASTLQGHGEFWDYFGLYGRGVWKGLSEDTLNKKLQYLQIVKNLPKDNNIQMWPPLIQETLDRAGWKKEEVNRGFFTQAKLETIEKVSEIFGWNKTMAYNIMHEYGYTGSACIPMAVDQANKKGLLKEGDKVIICTSGIGTSYACVALIWGKE